MLLRFGGSFYSIQCPASTIRRLTLLVHAGIFWCSSLLKVLVPYSVLFQHFKDRLLVHARIFWCSSLLKVNLVP